MKLLIFIPAFNCENQITQVLEKIQNFTAIYTFEVIVINNQSKDNTLNNVINYRINNQYNTLKIVSNSLNIGLGGTHKMAFQYAIDNNFDGCAVLHGDNQGNIQDLPIRQLNQTDFFFGSRFKLSSKLVNYSKFRILGNLVFNSIASLACVRLISDFGGSGLNYFPTKKLKEINFWLLPDDLTFHAYLLLNIVRFKFSYNMFSITWSEHDQISNVKLVSQSIKYLKILTKYILKNDLNDPAAKATIKNYVNWNYH